MQDDYKEEGELKTCLGCGVITDPELWCEYCISPLELHQMKRTVVDVSEVLGIKGTSYGD